MFYNSKSIHYFLSNHKRDTKKLKKKKAITDPNPEILLLIGTNPSRIFLPIVALFLSSLSKYKTVESAK